MKEMMYYFSIASEKMNLIQFNLILGEKTSKSEHEFIPHETKLLNEEETTYEMKQVGAVIFAENKTKKTLQIEQHYAGLV